MYRKGHYGVALLVFAPLGFGLILLGLPTVALLLGGVMLWLAMLPDVDHRLPLIEHRGPTHSLLFAGLVGAVFGAVGYLVGDPATLEALAGDSAANTVLVGGNGAWMGLTAQLQLASIGFLVGALAVLAHLLGDALTPAGVNFLWPVSRKTYSLYLTRADSTVWNYGLFAAGVFTAGTALYLATLLSA